jgi:hypothetical protein
MSFVSPMGSEKIWYFLDSYTSYWHVKSFVDEVMANRVRQHLLNHFLQWEVIQICQLEDDKNETSRSFVLAIAQFLFGAQADFRHHLVCPRQ